jgi:two-component system, NarL family, sensor histidine kinase ComP
MSRERAVDERYRIIAENTLDAMVLVDNQAVVRFVSPSILPITGYTVAEYEGMDAFEVIHAEDRERVRLLYAEVLRTRREVDLEYRILHADGRVIDAETRVKPVLDEEGAVQYVVAAVRDVTQRKRDELLIQNILDNVNVAAWSTDRHFSRMNVLSNSIERIIGIPKQIYMDNPILMHDHIHPDDNAVLMHEVKEKLDQGERVDIEMRMIHEPKLKWTRMIIHPNVNGNGDVERLDGIMVDITDKKRYEQALEESEMRYKSLFENNLDGVFSIELSGFYFVNANHAFESITGIKPEQLTNRCFLGMIHDEDHADIYGTLYRVMQMREPRDIECRINHSGTAGQGTGHGASERIVNITFVPIASGGELSGIHGIVKDITARKRDERELIQSEERYKSLQQSLNRFANDLANVMKVSELESRLLEEVKEILPAEEAVIKESSKEPETAWTEPGGNNRSKHGIRVRIGEKQQPVYLRIETSRALHRIEEEWLDTAVQYVTILYDNLQLLEDLMQRLEQLALSNETPKWMLRLLFQLSEKERAALSSDLHDSVLQDLIIWYRKLESLRSRSGESLPMPAVGELKQIEEGLLDAIHQIRITCNELRPPFLLKMGLVESLRSLFEYARMFANYEIVFDADKWGGTLGEDQLLGLYRIVQELLNNASKHAQASTVTMTLSGGQERVIFTYSDDGIGMDLSAFEGSFQHMGMAGIEKRVLSLEGEVAFRSAPREGFHVTIQLPTKFTA